MFSCEFCGKELSTKACLKTHQTKAKYCLEQQKINPVYTNCTYCDKSFSQKYKFTAHEKICDQKLSYEIKKKDEIINRLMLEVSDLKNKLERLEEKAQIYNDLFNKEQEFTHEQSKLLVSRASTTNNTIKGRYVTMNALNLSSEKLESIKDTYTLKHYEKGGEGQAEWVVDNILKDEDGNLLYKCTDKARKNFIYRDDKGNIINDASAKKLKESILPIMNDKLKEYKKIKYSELADVDDDDNSLLERCNDLYTENKELGVKFDKRLVEKTYG